MNTLLLVFPKILLIALLLHRYPAPSVQSGSVDFSTEEKEAIILLSESLYLQIPDDLQFVIHPQMRHQEEMAQLSALFLIEKDLLKTLSRKIHRSQEEWNYLLRRMDETYGEINRLMAVIYPPSSVESCENAFDSCLHQTRAYYCACTWEGIACKLDLCLTGLPQTDRQVSALSR